MSTTVLENIIVCQLVKKLVMFKGILYPQNFKIRLADTSETAKFNSHNQHAFFYDNSIDTLTSTIMSSFRLLD
jgi:hypothetical protein